MKNPTPRSRSPPFFLLYAKKIKEEKNIYTVVYEFVTERKTVDIEDGTALAIFLEKSDREIKNNQRRKKDHHELSLDALEKKRGVFLSEKNDTVDDTKLYQALKKLSLEERRFMYDLCVKKIKQCEKAHELGISSAAVCKRRKKILEKIKY